MVDVLASSHPRGAPQLQAPSTPALRLSVVICCYTMERWSRLVDAVASLGRQTRPPDEILVVVDHCEELAARAGRELAAAAGVGDVTVMESVGPQGLSGARNTGTEAAQSDVVAFLDDDATAHERWLERLARCYLDPDVIGAGGRVDPDWESGRPAWFPAEFDWVVGCTHSGMPTERTAVRNFVGANMSFRRQAIIDLGGFRSDLGRRRDGRPLGCEETELCIRSAAMGGRLDYQPAAQVSHHVPSGRQTWSYFRSRCYAEGLSKAAVAQIAGSQSGLADERRYVSRTLPAGVVRGLLSLAARRDVSGFARAAAIVIGFTGTVLGFLTGRFGQLRERLWATLVANVGALRALIPLLIAVDLWLLAMHPLPLRDMNDFGLISVLPATFAAALALVVISSVVQIHRARAPEWVLGAHLAVLIVILHATPALLYGSLRYSWAWKHVGIVDYVIRHGTVDPEIGNLAAYHAWPGFFTLNALLTQAGGLDSALHYAAWAPPVMHLLGLPLLLLAFRTVTLDRRRVWLGLLLFYLADWVGQEYFSPQAFSYLLYLAILMICLRWMRPTGAGIAMWARGRLARMTRPIREPLTRRERAGLLAVVVVMAAAIASSHQLTPFMLISALAMLVLARQVGPAWLPWAAGALAVAWIGLMAQTFLSENLYWIVQSIGRPADNTQVTFIDLTHASYGQLIVATGDRLLTASVGLLAVIGLARSWRAGRRELVPVLLVLAPMPMLLANDYGGEMLFRVYLFALPGLAILAAAVFYPGGTAGGRAAVPASEARPVVRALAGVVSRLTLPIALGLAAAMTAAFCLAYYGKERMNYFTPEEIAGSEWLYAHAPQGSLIVAPTANFPWAFTHYETYQYEFFDYLSPQDRQSFSRTPMNSLVALMGGGKRQNAYFVIDRSSLVSVQYTGVLSYNAMPALALALPHATQFQAVFHNRDAVIYRLARTPSTPANRTPVQQATQQPTQQPTAPRLPGTAGPL